MTRLVAKDTSSDTITFEDEAFPPGKEQGCESLLWEWGYWGGGGETVSLEMTHGTNLEVSGFPPNLYRSIPWPNSLFEGKEENVSTS